MLQKVGDVRVSVSGDDIMWYDEYDERMTNGGVSNLHLHTMLWHGLGTSWAPCTMHTTYQIQLEEEYIYMEEEEIIQRHYTR